MLIANEMSLPVVIFFRDAPQITANEGGQDTKRADIEFGRNYREIKDKNIKLAINVLVKSISASPNHPQTS